LELKMRRVSEQIAARDAKIRKENMEQVETKLAAAEKRMSRHIKDSIAQLPGQDTQSAGNREVLYRLALESKKAGLRDSLELAYGLRTVQQDTVIPRAPDFPDYETSSRSSGTFTQLLVLLSGLLIGMIIFSKVIKGKTISMGGQQLSAGAKILV